MAKRFFTNEGNNTLIKEFEGIIENNPSIKNLDALVGFLRASGYFNLRPFLDGIDKVRILIGIDVDKYIVEAHNKGVLFMGASEEVKDEYLRKLKRDIESANYTQKVEDGIFQMVKDIQDGKLELRAHPSKKIHAKIYLLYPHNFNDKTFAAAITGSSNLTGNGLGIENDRQYEFNVKLHNYEDVNFAKEEFERLWDEARGCLIEAQDVKTAINNTYLREDVTPYELYIKMLMEYFKDRNLDNEITAITKMPEGYSSYEYQTDAVIEGYQKLLKYNLFCVAGT